MGLLITLFLGLFFIVGTLITKFSKNTELVENLSVSIALGTMSSLVILELIPEVLEHMEKVNIAFILLLVVVGIAILKVLDLFVPEHDHEHSLHHDCSHENLLHIGIVSLVAIILHNIIEGMAVYSLTVESFKTGMLVALGVGLHNIPMGMVISSTLDHESKKNRVVALFLATISTFIGGLIMFLINNLISDLIIGILISITLGMISYIVLFELIPHVLHSDDKKISLFGVVVGIIIILLSTMFE